MTHDDLVDQPTAAPTRKMAAVGISGALIPPLAAAIVSQVPAISEACGGEIAAGIIVLVTGYAQHLVTFVTGYQTRERD
jgi:hypothetical protein